MSKNSRVIILSAVLIGFIAGVIGPVNAQSTMDHLKVFVQVLRYVKAYYVEDVDSRGVVNDAIRGMLEDLDPHSQYVEADALASMNWIGTDDPKGTRPVPRAQLLTLRLEPGAKAVGKSVPDGILLEDKKTGYLTITRFGATTAGELGTVLEDLQQKGMERLILDLRNNPGGLLSQAIEVADTFIDGHQVLVYTQGRIDGASQHYYATDSVRQPHYPLIVLVNRASASASELVAGAIQDHDRGIVAGARTFGHGLVQQRYMLEDGSALFLTVANFHTPSGRVVQRPYKDPETYRNYQTEPVPSGSLETPAEADTAIFYTLYAHRQVRGGGGITPDIHIPASPGTSGVQATGQDVRVRLAQDPMLAEALRHFPEAEAMAKAYAALPKEKR